MDLTEHQHEGYHKLKTMIYYFISSYYAQIVILSIFVVLAVFLIFTGYSPIHDAISWHGVFHYFYSSVENGVLPYWNPYSQTGTPFYVYYQPFGLLEPSNFFFVLVQKITGCTTFTTYILHYLFYYFVFVLGAYYLLREIIKNNKVCVLFAVILFFGCFPMFMRQNGTLNSFFLVPFIFYFLLIFLDEQVYKRKALSAVLAVYLSAISLNINIPTGVMFAVMLFFILSLLLKSSRIKQTFEFIKTRQGTLISSLSIIMIMLIACPVLALYHDLHNDSEMFPTVRVLQKNKNKLVKLYATDIKEDLFSEKYTSNQKVSNNSLNLFGLISEPENHLLRSAISSENFMYVGILPLLCCIVAFRNRKYDAQVYLFSLMTFFVFFLMINFSTDIVSKPGVFQSVIISTVPFLKSMEVLQNFAPLFLLCIIIVGALGFNKIQNDDQIIWNVSIVVVVLKLLLFLTLTVFIIVMKHLFYRDIIITFVVITMLIILSTNTFFSKVNKNKLKIITIILLFLDLFIFAVFHTTHFKLNMPNLYYEKVLDNKYHSILEHDKILVTRHEENFINYRVPFSSSPLFSKDSKLFATFWGLEVYSAKKTAFANVYRIHLFKDFAPSWDHFYMTKYYYDHLVNIAPARQLMTANIITPILNYYPKENVKFFENKYDVVESINRSEISELKKYIFIEGNKDEKLTSPLVASFFDPDKRLRFNKNEINDFTKNENRIYYSNKKLSYTITNYDINNLSLDIETPKAGFFYFGDGYSKYWNADVDGIKTEIYKTNINSKSIYVPSGAHHVRFHYDPTFFRYSLYAYFMGNILALSIIAVLYFRSKQDESVKA